MVSCNYLLLYKFKVAVLKYFQKHVVNDCGRERRQWYVGLLQVSESGSCQTRHFTFFDRYLEE